ncbi:MAG: hypothetical protein GYA21_18525 [Myxococcales bacterium]|nr:hypothetical protein [Myxococcales bacterium]
MRKILLASMAVLVLCLPGCSGTTADDDHPGGDAGCTPDCTGRACGFDPRCGTSCGACAPGDTCDDQGTCRPGCVPDCTGRICGSDGCGGSCGNCDPGAGQVCVEASGQCVVCAPDCRDLECGPDPVCGALCGTCEGGFRCSATGQCEEVCRPDCQGRACGLDPVCGTLECGACPPGEACDAQGRCGPACVPDCQGRVCGLDPVCGTLECGACPGEERCDAGGQCRPACGDFCAPFSVVLLPDTQYYTKKQPAGPDNTLFKQMQWILDHRQSHDIRFVIHLGDITHNNTLEQWRVADQAFDLLDAAGMPYSLVPGNHDYLKAEARYSRGNTHLNDPELFPPARFSGRPWYGGSYGGGSENSYALFEAGPYRFLVINLEYGPRKGPLCWAEELIAAYPDRRVIVVSHCVQTHGGEYEQGCPSIDYLIPGGSGETIWDELASRHSNVFLVLCGHVNDTEYKLRYGNAGNPVHAILTDYQFEAACTAGSAAACTDHCQAGFYTGNGWMRELVFAPRENRVYARTFTVEDGNPAVFPDGVPAFFCNPSNVQGKRWYPMDPADGAHQFEFPYDFSPVAPDVRTEGSRAFTDQTINTVADGDQLRPVLAGRGVGGFVAVWEDDSSDDDGAGNFDVMVRGFHAGGCQAFSQRQVNPNSAGQQGAPAVGMAADGSFVVAWEDDADGNGTYQIHARGFNADGSERIARFSVNRVDTGQQRNPAVGVSPDGRFVVAWEDDRDKNGAMQVWVRGFNADGSERFSERSVHADANGKRQRPAVAATADGGFVVAWEDDSDGNGTFQIHARGFDASGAGRLARLTVNSEAAGQQRSPVIATDAGGGFVVVWEDDRDGDGNLQLWARGFEPDGRQRFADRRVHQTAGGDHRSAALGMAGSGAFAIAWQDDGDGNGVYQIRAAVFSASGGTGATLLPEQTINRVADGQQLGPGLALSDLGDLAVAWQDDMDDNDAYQILARGLVAWTP